MQAEGLLGGGPLSCAVDHAQAFLPQHTQRNQRVAPQRPPGPAKAGNEEADEDDDACANALVNGLPAVRVELHCQQHRHHNLPKKAHAFRRVPDRQ